MITNIQCRRISELIPWYVNGSLATGERQTVKDHLGRCPSCALEAKTFLQQLQLGHPSAEALLEFAMHAAAGTEHRALETHLETCAGCRADLVLLRRAGGLDPDRTAGRPAAAQKPAATTVHWQRRLAPVLKIAAVLVAIFGASLLPTALDRDQRPVVTEQPAPAHPGVMFSDGFETGDLSDWSVRAHRPRTDAPRQPKSLKG